MTPAASAAVLAALALLVILIAAVMSRRAADAFSGCRSCGGPSAATDDRQLRGSGWVGGRGPYNLQLYDSPRYYPYYESRDYANAWDTSGRCSVSCSASEDGGCAVVCR